MNDIKHTSVDRVFVKLERDYGISTANEGDIIEWIGEALSFIGVVNQYEEAVCFVEVNNYQIAIPLGFHKIIQIARNGCYNEAPICPANLVNANGYPIPDNPAENPAPAIPVILDCNGTPLQDYDLAYYRPYFDLRFEYSGWMGTSAYRSCFHPVKPSKHSFFDGLICEDKNCGQERLYTHTSDEYKIIKGDFIRFSFDKGQVAIAYLRQVVDEETGYPMIPDDVSVVEALANYIVYKNAKKDFYRNREGSQARMEKAQSDWQWYCKQAGNKLMAFSGVDDFQDLLNQRRYLIPQDSYYSYFGKFNNREQKIFNATQTGGYNRFRGYHIN